jgi:hypothetical protein
MKNQGKKDMKREKSYIGILGKRGERETRYIDI